MFSRSLNGVMRVAFAGVGTLAVVGSLAIYSSLSSLVGLAKEANAQSQVARQVGDLYAEGLQMGQATRNIMLDPKNPQAWKNHEAASKNAQALIADLSAVVAKAEDQAGQSGMESIRKNFDADVQLQKRVQELARAGDFAGSLALLNSKETPSWRQVKAQILALRDKTLKTLEATNAGFEARTRRANLEIAALAVVLGLAPFVAWALALRVSRQLRQTASQLREAAEQVVAASTQVSTSAQSLSQGATEQAASLEESSASMEEMGSMTRQNAENAQEAARLMTEVDQQVAASNRMLGEMVTSMSRHQGVEREGLEDHQDHRRDRVPDQHPRAERGGRSRARRRGGHGLRRRRRRGAQPRAAGRAGRARHGGPHRGVVRERAAGQPAGGARGAVHRAVHRVGGQGEEPSPRA